MLNFENALQPRILRLATLGSACTSLWLPQAPAGQLLPNPDFESGTSTPADWRLVDGTGQYHRSPTGAYQGHGWISVTGSGEDQGSWQTPVLPLRPGGLYRFGFLGRREPDGGEGCAVAGPSRVNRDFRLNESWDRQGFTFRLPDDLAEGDFIRLGQWRVKGTLSFDAAELRPVLAGNRRVADGFELGEAESIRGGIYRFQPDLNWVGANAHRPLATNRAGFNSNRWLFYPHAEVVYHHRLGSLLQTQASVRVGINYYAGGTLRIQASTNGSTWVDLAAYGDQQRGGKAELPAGLFPANQVWVRLIQPDPGGGLQVDTYEYEAALAGQPTDAEGETHFLEVLEDHPNLVVAAPHFEKPKNANASGLALRVTNTSDRPRQWRGRTWVTRVDGSQPSSATVSNGLTLRLGPGETQTLLLPIPDGEPENQLLWIEVADRQGPHRFQGRIERRRGFLEREDYGYWLSARNGVGLWWCESGWKIGRDRGMPPRPRSGRPGPVTVSAARGEDEAVQVVLRPDLTTDLIAAAPAPFRGRGGLTGRIELRVDEVAYVQVTQPTDASCQRGWYPDPLPPLPRPLRLKAGINQPLWLTFRVSRDAAPGVYQSQLRLATREAEWRVPLQVRVYDFELPRETHLHSALGLGAGGINRYHGLTRRADQVAVFERYLQNFAEHRISPYSFYDYAPIGLAFAGAGNERHAQLDLTQFDLAARRWLDEGRFNTFQLPVHGMGGGTFHERYLGELDGFKEGTPEHARLFQDYLSQVEHHLRERGWLGKAFTYWFDEPDPKDYEFVVAGMKRLKAAAPGIRRMLTEQPEPALEGHVDIWCGLTPEWTPERVKARRARGEEVWWYICTAPKSPYVTEFIDHPGTELRLWPWQSWQYGISGLLVWATVYWTSPVAYPEPTLQDPWEDPMSWVSGYGTPVGTRSPWGNGDGRFLYPPRRDPNRPLAPVLDGPVNSIRWENLRDGMEDYEYLWLLEQAVNRAASTSIDTSLLQEARRLLEVPPNLSKDLTHFTTDPRVILAHRHRVAEMIARLGRR